MNAKRVLSVVAGLLLVTGCGSVSISVGTPPPVSGGSQGNSQGNPGNVQWGNRTKTSGCVASGGLPDRACTPGAVFSNVTRDQVCTPGYARSVRDVPTEVKDEVYREYGIASHFSGQYEVDHLVSLELGGSNDIANLWPEAADPKPGFHQKDEVENYLHEQICSRAVSLQDAQQQIATNWLAVYSRMTGVSVAPPPPPVGQPTAQPSGGGASNGKATALCRDNTYWYGTSHSGACSRHGGVAQWYN